MLKLKAKAYYMNPEIKIWYNLIYFVDLILKLANIHKLR